MPNLTLGETFDDRRHFILACIGTSRALIKTIAQSKLAYTELARDVIKIEKQYIRDQINELVLLKRSQKGVEGEEIGLRKETDSRS